jgi:Alpha amylase, catalytic domain
MASTPTEVAAAQRAIAYPLLYEVYTRAALAARARALGRPATLDDIPDSDLDDWAARKFDFIWMLGVWQTGAAGRAVSRAQPSLRHEYERTLSDLTEDDICGSCFAVQGYSVHTDFGGPEALARFRERLKRHGLRLMLDFVPNHSAPDHPWVFDHPEFYVPGTEDDLARAQHNYARVETRQGPMVLAYGRDPYFPGWPDTFQLNYGHAGLRAAMELELHHVAEQCDGVRCDMSMLLLPEVFERTWGIATQPFWPKAIQRVRREIPDFTFMAEAYWDLEWTMQLQGFDFVYDKRLYDRLRELHARPVRDHLRAEMAFQNRLARFLENHDEPRAAESFPPDIHRAAAVITFLSPGLRLFHDGQFEGRKVRIPVHLRRGPEEQPDQALQDFYGRLLAVLDRPGLRSGPWWSLDPAPAWDGNGSWDGFIAGAWGNAGQRLVVAVNYANIQGQCYVRLPFPEFSGRRVRLADRMSDAIYERDGDALLTAGLYLDMPAWGYHAFALDAVPA